MIAKVISGGQTGADQGALRAALTMGIPTGGYAPEGFYTEEGKNPALKMQFGLIDSGKDYAARTKLNVDAADATLIFGARSVGSILTMNLAVAANKPYKWVSMNADFKVGRESVLNWLAQHPEIQTLNVAGNRESKSPGIGRFVENFMLDVLANLMREQEVELP